VNPEDAAAARFRPIAKTREQIAKTEQAHAAALARLEALRGQLAPAERRDSELLGEALVEGKREPLSEAEAIRAEVAQQELRVDALRLAADRARRQIPKLVHANRAGWRRQAMRELGREKHRYEAAISELQAAREALVDVATLVRWLDSGDLGEAATGLALDRMLVELRNDAEQLAAYPDRRPQPEPQVDIEQMRDGRAAASLWVGR
jgi:chromosome segregation ATPase